jgi:hypothetical protein
MKNRGSDNTGSGFLALAGNTTGINNTAAGFQALLKNTTGIDETAIGGLSLQNNTTGNFNTSAGYRSLGGNTTGTLNTAAGVNALLRNTSGASNTAVGANAMFNNTAGSNNIALGVGAGQALTVGNNNIEIGNSGLAAETNGIRIGKQGTQTHTYIAGISGVPITGAPVEVSSTGQLGIVMSSARYKHDIRNMGSATERLMRLRPVTFRYNNDPSGALQYGLVAEEVAKVYPELVDYGPDSKVQTVRYSMLSSMLLNELQKQNAEVHRRLRENERQARQIDALSTQVAQQRAELISNRERQRIVLQRLAKLEHTLAAGYGGRMAAAFAP